jgi:hypothetical protein
LTHPFIPNSSPKKHKIEIENGVDPRTEKEEEIKKVPLLSSPHSPLEPVSTSRSPPERVLTDSPSERMLTDKRPETFYDSPL